MSIAALPRTSIVTVTYNSAEVLPDMLASIPSGVPVIIVDNNSDDTSCDIAARSGAQLVRLEANLGFGCACNAGAALTNTEFVLFLNPDAVLDPSCIAALEDAADKYTGASAFNPRIGDRNGADYFKRRSVLLPRSQWMPRGWPEHDREVPVLSGAAYFCRKSCFDGVGGFDPEIFLYHEDDDISLRMAKEFGPLMFIRDASIIHQEGRSSPRTAAVADIKSFYMGKSRVYTMRKHKQPMPFLTNFAAAVFKLFSPLNLISSRKRAQAFGYAKGVLSTL